MANIVCGLYSLFYCNIHGLHGPAGACILVASVSPIHVPPTLKHCGGTNISVTDIHVWSIVGPMLHNFNCSVLVSHLWNTAHICPIPVHTSSHPCFSSSHPSLVQPPVSLVQPPIALVQSLVSIFSVCPHALVR